MMEYNIGDTVVYRTFGGDKRTVRVTFKSDDIKNGRPGFDGVVVSSTAGLPDTRVWGYDDQITEVKKVVGK